MKNIKIVKLTNKFYNKYKDCKEILHKNNRPYLILLIKINDTTFAIPFRSNLNHKYGYKLSDNGVLDFLKAIPIIDNGFIDNKLIKIKREEFNKLNSEYNLIFEEFEKFIKVYIKAINNPKKRNEYLRLYSTLQYFQDIVKIL